MRMCRRLVLTLFVLIVLLVVTAGWLVSSQSGLQTLIAAANRWVPGLTIQQATGWLTDMTVQNVHYQRPGVDVQVAKAHLALSVRCLWQRQICINEAAAAGVVVQVDSRQLAPATKTEKLKVADVIAPVPLTVRNVALDQLHVAVDGHVIDLQHVHSGASWQGNRITVQPTLLRGLQLSLVSQSPSGKASLNNTSSPNTLPPAQQLRQVFGSLVAPLLPDLQQLHLPMQLTVQSFDAEQLQFSSTTAKQPFKIQQLALQLTSDQQHIRLDKLYIDSDAGQFTASGKLQSQGDWPVQLSVSGTVHAGLLTRQKLELTVSGALGDTLRLQGSGSGNMNASIEASVQPTHANLPFSLQVNSQQLHWPLNVKPDYQLKQLRIQSSGTITDYSLNAQGALHSEKFPASVLNVQLKGNTQQLSVQSLQLATLQGKVDIQGALDWSQRLQFQSQIQVAGINGTKYYPDWPFTLDGQFKVHGSVATSDWQIALSDLQLQGKIKQNGLKLSGSLTGNSRQQWQVDHLQLVLGRNTLAVNGQVSDKALALDAEIHAPALDNALPYLAGQIQGTLRLHGTPDAAQLDSDITAEAVRWQDMSLGQLTAKARISLNQMLAYHSGTGKPLAGTLQIDAKKFQQGNVTISQLAVKLQGDERAHQLNMVLQGKPISARLTLQGGYQRQQQRWQGSLSQANIISPVGSWQASRAITLDYRIARQSLIIGAHCWNNPQAEVCLQNTASAGRQGRVALQVNKLNLVMFKALLPTETQLSGGLTASADITWDSDRAGLPQGRITVTGQGVKLTQQVGGNPLTLLFDKLSAHTQLQRNQAELGWLVSLHDNGQFSGDIQVGDPQTRRLLSGKIAIDNFALSIANALLSQQGGKVEGVLNGQLQLSGNAKKPLLQGDISARGVNVSGNFMPFAMQPSQLMIQFQGVNSTLQGAIHTSEGQIILQGQADWQQPENWHAQVYANGERVRLSVPPGVRLDVSPNVMLEASPQQINLKGDINIPWGRITVQELPENAVDISKDVVMLDNNLQPVEKREASIPINSSLKIHVGDDVQLDAFGLKVRLNGNLQVTQHKQALGLSGQISIPQGRFRAYGQDLLVRRGELLFSGSPDHVLLNVEAIRNPQSTADGVIAGVRVTGSSDEPKVEVFSDPAMSQQEALSYLLRGQGLQSKQSDGAAMTSALIGLGVAQSGRIIGRIGEAFGISNLTLDTESIGDNSQVVLSGYLFHNLQVKYGVGIFDSLATLTLRYRLLPKLYLEAVSGVDQALDLLYQFEF